MEFISEAVTHTTRDLLLSHPQSSLPVDALVGRHRITNDTPHCNNIGPRTSRATQMQHTHTDTELHRVATPYITHHTTTSYNPSSVLERAHPSCRTVVVELLHSDWWRECCVKRVACLCCWLWLCWAAAVAVLRSQKSTAASSNFQANTRGCTQDE